MSEQESNSGNVMPGEEPISTDDLIFQIGEKEVDNYRKQSAIKKLINTINNYDAKVKELDQAVRDKDSEIEQTKANSGEIEKERKEKQNLSNSVSEKDKEIEKLRNNVDELENLRKTNRELENQISEKDKEVEELKKKMESQGSEIQERLEKERDKVKKLRTQLDETSSHFLAHGEIDNGEYSSD